MHLQLNAPFCAKCKKPVDRASVNHDPMRQVFHLRYSCHGTEAEWLLPQVEAFNLKPTSILIDFTEFRKVEDADSQDICTRTGVHTN